MSENKEKDIDAEDAEDLAAVSESGGQADQDAPVYERRETAPANQLKRAIFSVPIEVVVSVGTARPLIGELLDMERDHLLPLDSRLEDPVELRVRDRVIARGELAQTSEEEGGGLGVRLTEIVDMSDIV
ncbi:MAG: FliM/FliN family flagellar motor switch protein [Parvularculaceae bacterium]